MNDSNRVAIITFLIVGIMLLVTMFCQPKASAGEIELGASVTQGQSRSESYLVGLEYSRGPLSLDLDYSYAETNDETTTDQGYIALAYDRDLTDRWSLWLFNQSGYNNIREIDTENFLGLGPKFYLVKSSTIKLSFSAGYLNQYTDYASGASEVTHRMSYHPKFSWIGGGVEMMALFFYQPNLNDPDDYITISEASYSVAITDALALKATVKDEYRSISSGAKHEMQQYISLGMRF